MQQRWTKVSSQVQIISSLFTEDKERPKPNMRNFRLMGQKSCESVDNVDASEIRLTR